MTDGAGASLDISRDYKMAARELVAAGGQRCTLTMDSMGQLASFVTSDNVSVYFTYLDNSGLIESKETGAGQTFVYEYDGYGRMNAVVQPTGERLVVAGDQATAPHGQLAFSRNYYTSSSQPGVKVRGTREHCVPPAPIFRLYSSPPEFKC